MTREIEKKYRIDDRQRAAVRLELSDAGAKCLGERFEENLIYGGGPLADSDALLRIRRTGEGSLLTYKRPVPTEGGLKTHIEYETEIADADAAVSILGAIGCDRRLVYEKRRETWLFRDVEVELDELPFGLFMEIEGTKEAILEAESFLGAQTFEVEPETYPGLTAVKGFRTGSVIESRFSEETNRARPESE